MVSVDVTLSTHKMMSPDFESMNNCCQFKIMGWVVFARDFGVLRMHKQ
jgi:hypothetical protein